MPNVQVSAAVSGTAPVVPNVQVNAAVSVTAPVVPSRSAPDQELQELWLALSVRPWRSLVLVPADPGGSTAPLARSLAAAGDALGDQPVTASGDDALEPGAALALVDGGARSSRVVVAIPPVVVQPRGVLLARRADAVVACVEQGRTRLADVRRTLELIGRERFLGCVLVR
jgi:hypothetical protein